MGNETKSITCKNAVPINCSIIEKEDQGIFANTSYLCKNENDKLFIINRIYKVEDEEDALSFECLPFADFDSDFITAKIENNWLTTCLPRFTTNLQFYINEEFFEIYTYGIESTTGTKFKINLPNEIFMSLLFLDKYPIESDPDNDHDLSLAILNSSKPSNNLANICKVSSAKVVELGAINFKSKEKNFFRSLRNVFTKEELIDTNIAVKLELGDYYDLDSSVQLLVPFDIGEVFDESKFKGLTFEDLQQNYLEDPNHYVGNLIVSSVKLYGADENFMVIRGENKNKEVKIFLINDLQKESINNEIIKY